MANTQLTMAGLGTMLLSVVLIVVIFQIVPVIGYSVDNAVDIPVNSTWNASTAGSSLPNGSETWGTLASFGVLTAVILFVGGFIGALKGIRG